MLDLIIVIFIFYFIYKKINNVSTNQLTTILQAKEFNNISTIKKTSTSSWITANFHGENYLFEIMNNNSSVSNANVNDLIDYASKTHFHNIIIIPSSSGISNTAKLAIKKYNIQIWDKSKLNNFSTQSSDNVSSAIIQKIPLNDKCKIDIPDDPIQDGAKANSILGNFFNNKVEKL